VKLFFKFFDPGFKLLVGQFFNHDFDDGERHIIIKKQDDPISVEENCLSKGTSLTLFFAIAEVSIYSQKTQRIQQV
jgi:hypothetical protein